MSFTITLTLYDLYCIGFFSFIAILFYIYTKIDGDDHLTHIRHNIEMKKEWFRMLAERNKNAIR